MIASMLPVEHVSWDLEWSPRVLDVHTGSMLLQYLHARTHGDVHGDAWKFQSAQHNTAPFGIHRHGARGTQPWQQSQESNNVDFQILKIKIFEITLTQTVFCEQIHRDVLFNNAQVWHGICEKNGSWWRRILHCNAYCIYCNITTMAILQ